MDIKSAGVKASIVIKGYKPEREPNDANWLTVEKFYGDVGQTYPRPSKTGEAIACRFPKHLAELGTRQVIQTIAFIEQKHAERYSHRA